MLPFSGGRSLYRRDRSNYRCVLNANVPRLQVNSSAGPFVPYVLQKHGNAYSKIAGILQEVLLVLVTYSVDFVVFVKKQAT
jgi:hypothetical protein